MYKPTAKASRKKKPQKKPPKEFSYKLRAKKSLAKKQTVYRIDTSSAVYIYANLTQARRKAAHLDRKLRRIYRADGIFIELRDNIRLHLSGIRPKQVQVLADGTALVNLVITTKESHAYSAVYTKDSFRQIRQRIREDGPGATLGYTSKNPEVLAHILRCLDVAYTDSEFETLVAKMNDSLHYDEQLGQDVRISRRGIFFAKRTSKSGKLLGPMNHSVLPTPRKKRCSRLLGPERK